MSALLIYQGRSMTTPFSHSKRVRARRFCITQPAIKTTAVFVLVLAVLLATGALRAQALKATILATITDRSGAVVPGVELVLP
jgi:hypothetical protein